MLDFDLISPFQIHITEMEDLIHLFYYLKTF